MSIRLDPRRLGALKQLAGEAGVRPGELVLRWVEERLDAERRGPVTPAAAGAAPAAELEALTARIDELATRITGLERDRAMSAPAVAAAVEAPDGQPVKRRPGRPRKAPAPTPTAPRVALHDEITTVIEERGASTAAEIALAIAERGRYTPPRSGRGLDAATINSRVSNPAYRDRFRRQDGRIGLAERA